MKLIKKETLKMSKKIIISYHFINEHNLISWKMSGNVNAAKIIASVDEAVNHKNYILGMNAFIDCRGMSTSWNIDDIYNISLEVKYILNKLKDKVKVAALFDSNTQYYMGKVYSAYSKTTQADFSPFKKMEVAKKWLGLDPDTDL